ncbi:unnamed protein product [Pseudo-nitzschia multistriata]|uniref:Uncharacterized protein n=1 Tax=Pseudo-nitzschia multistriata TaxID=183589 RepID=A0A448ZT38_9STRA|nr:unnamed protein product [Pseudo-nitzschia multistriata]
MAIRYEAPPYAPQPGGGGSLSITVKPERWRLFAYGFFWSLMIFAKLVCATLVEPIIEAGAPPDTPAERLGCGPFNREGGPFDLEYGMGFTLDESHLTQIFGYANSCVVWDYTPAREMMAMYFPFFEYSLVIYLFLDYTSTMLSYRRGELPEWYWKLMQVVTPINIFLAAMFRMIFVCVAYEQIEGHALAFLGFQVVLLNVAITNAMYIWLTGQEYTRVTLLPCIPKISLSAPVVAFVTKIYLICTVAISVVKIYGTLLFVLGGDISWYLIPVPFTGKVLGQIIDLIWMTFNAILPFYFAYVRAENEDPFIIEIDAPKHIYRSRDDGGHNLGDANGEDEPQNGDSGPATETTGLLTGGGSDDQPPDEETPDEAPAPPPVAPTGPRIIQGQENLDSIKGSEGNNDNLANIFKTEGYTEAEAILVDGGWISDIFLPSGCPEGSKLTVRCNSTWNVKIGNLKGVGSKVVATKQRLVVVVIDGVWTIQEWADEKGPFVVKGQQNLDRFKGTGGKYFVVVANKRVVYHNADLEACKNFLMTKFGHGASRPSRMVVDVSGGKVSEDPHSCGGQNQGGGMKAGFNKWWQGWPDIRSMNTVAKTFLKTNKVGGPPKNDNLLHLFNPKDYKDVELHTYDGSWIRELYLPKANGILSGSSLTIKCNSTWGVKVLYPGNWQKDVATKTTLALIVKEGKWIVKK